MKVAVGLSGGIDSTACILRLHEAGHDVIGITMKATFHNQEYGKCCTIEDVHDAKKICDSISVRHYVVDVKDEFQDKIVNYFVDEYLRGRTPNPCIFCNELIKFKRLMEAANTLGYDQFATGHYAILDWEEDIPILRKGVDPAKDQAYFLSRLPLSLLKNCLFPLGNTVKKDNLDFLKERNIDISKKKESHEICFVPGDDYSQFLRDQAGDRITAGDIIDEQGQKIGSHDGIPYYTIGQRRGLNVAMGKPVYVREMDAISNTITVGDRPYDDECYLEQVNWLAPYDFENPEILQVKVRYFHEGEMATLCKTQDDRIFLKFHKPVFSVTKGQAAVGYREDRVIFSGIIC